jgi:hypothetical protein
VTTEDRFNVGIFKLISDFDIGNTGQNWYIYQMITVVLLYNYPLFVCSYPERSVVESVVVAVLEEVSVAVGVPQGVIYIIGYPLPVGDRPEAPHSFH